MTFRTVTLKEVSGGGTYGFIASASSSPSGQKFLRTTDIVSGVVDWSSVPYCAISASQIEKFRLSHEDIVISRTGANAGVNTLVLNPPENSVFAGYLVRFRIDKRLAEPKYVSYVLRSKVWKNFVEAHRTGSAQPQLNAQIMGSFEFKLPSLPVQRRVGQFLAAMDDNIHSNAQLSATLESLAQTIFKSWFIDFDPVKAKSRGEEPEGMDAETAALFPESFEDSELGQIPVGWEFGKVKDLVTLVKDTVKAGPTTLSRPYVPIDVIRPKNLFLHDVAPSEEARTSLLSFERGDVLFGAMRPYFHKVCIAPFSGTTRSTNFVLRPKAHRSFSALYLSLDSTVDFATKHSQGSTIPYAVWANGLAEMDVVMPSTPVLDAFEAIARPLFDLGESLIRQNKVIAEIRDALMPHLISGELEIPEEALVQ